MKINECPKLMPLNGQFKATGCKLSQNLSTYFARRSNCLKYIPLQKIFYGRLPSHLSGSVYFCYSNSLDHPKIHYHLSVWQINRVVTHE